MKPLKLCIAERRNGGGGERESGNVSHSVLSKFWLADQREEKR